MDVIWSPEILQDIENLAEYLYEEWPASVWINFKNDLFRKIDLLSEGVLQGRPAQRFPSVLSVSITKHNRLYYEGSK